MAKVELKPCCTWETFKESFDYIVKHQRFPEILIDEEKVNHCWKRGMTGREAFITVTKEERQQAMDVKNAEFSKRLSQRREIGR